MSKSGEPTPTEQSRVSRRDFLRAAGSSTLLTAATAENPADGELVGVAG